MNCPGIKVHFLPINCVPVLSKKSKYNKLFDVVYFSNRYEIKELAGRRVAGGWMDK